MDTARLKIMSKNRLAENRWPMVIVSLILLIVGGFITVTTTQRVNVDYNAIAGGASNIVQTVSETSPILTWLGFAITVLIRNPIQVGGCHFFRKNIYENAVIEDIKRGFSNYFNIVITMLVMTIIVSVGTALCIVPGIIASLGLMLVPYILAENPNLGVIETLTLSWNKMKGHKAEYFMLLLSFIGWIILGVLTFGLVLVFYGGPYMNQTFAAYADSILNERVPDYRQSTWDDSERDF